MMYKNVILPEKCITPQDFGAAADGIRDDLDAICRAIDYVRENDALLVLSDSAYLCSDTILFEGIKVLSQNARIIYNGHTLDAPGVYVGNNTEIYGNINIDANNDPQDHYGQRAGMAFGDFYTGVGSHHCYVESVVLTGGIKNANGIVIVGDSSDIVIDRVFIPDGTNICRGICLHWGNRRAHHTVNEIGTGFDPSLGERGYVHDPEGGPTTHPHDIHIGRVECSGFKPIEGESSDGDKAAVIICACYDITVDEIIMHDSCHAFAVTGADNGFEYADRAVRERENKIIHVGRIEGTAMRSAGVFLIDTPWYISNAHVEMNVSIDECFVEATDRNTNVGVEVVGIKSAKFGKVTVKGFTNQAFDVLGDAKEVSVDELTVENCKGAALYVREQGGKGLAENVRINKLNLLSHNTAQKTVVVENAKSLNIGQINVK